MLRNDHACVLHEQRLFEVHYRLIEIILEIFIERKTNPSAYIISNDYILYWLLLN